ILGSRIGTYDWKEWLEMISTGNLTAQHSKTSIGAILLGLGGIFLAKKMLNFRQPVLPVYAIAIPVALFFQRVACLFAGCCFGLPTDASFGIQYQGFSFIRDRHLEAGLIKFNEMTSHTVYPVPVYFMLAYALSI